TGRPVFVLLAGLGGNLVGPHLLASACWSTGGFLLPGITLPKSTSSQMLPHVIPLHGVCERPPTNQYASQERTTVVTLCRFDPRVGLLQPIPAVEDVYDTRQEQIN
ncbi:hypothetical protein C8R46DRAFT_1095609, partial [Mycena filopes]